MIFWTFRPAVVMGAIQASGFVGTASAAALDAAQNQRHFPFRLPFLAAAVVGWNALILLDRPWETGQPGAGTAVALALAFVVSAPIQVWTPMQRIALRSPDALIRARPILRLVAGVVFAMAVLILPRLL